MCYNYRDLEQGGDVTNEKKVLPPDPLLGWAVFQSDLTAVRGRYTKGARLVNHCRLRSVRLSGPIPECSAKIDRLPGQTIPLAEMVEVPPRSVVKTPLIFEAAPVSIRPS